MVNMVGSAAIWFLLLVFVAAKQLQTVHNKCMSSQNFMATEFGIHMIFMCHEKLFCFFFHLFTNAKSFLVHKLYESRCGPHLARGLQLANPDIISALYIQQPRVLCDPWFFLCFEPNIQFILYHFIYFTFSGFCLTCLYSVV